MNITITDKAKAKLLEFQQDNNSFLRLGVTAGGCSGMTYTAAIDADEKDGDEVVFQDGDLRLVADQRSTLFLDGLVIDYSDDLIQAGFRLSNPNASKSCGCGASFGV